MATRKELQEQYEDAQFALLMDQIMEMQGAELEERNRQLKADPAAAVPREVREHSMETIRRAYDARDKQKKSRRIKTTVRTVLLAAVVAALLLTTVSADFRLAARNFVYELSELAAELMFDFGDDKTDESSKGEVILGYYIPALPGEFELVASGENGLSVWRQYENNDGFVMIKVLVNDGDGLDYHVDSEDIVCKSERINQFDVLIFESGNRIQFVLSDMEAQKHIEITSTVHTTMELRKYIGAIK